MNDPQREELLSAYLDGELTAAEQAQVERLLRASLEARQLLDELRAVSSTLQGLPQQKLKEDLSQQVLQIAQRRRIGTSSASPETATTPRESRLRRMLSPRALVWSGLALAVAVVITVLDHNHQVPPRDAADRVAMVPTAPAAAPVVEPSFRAAGEEATSNQAIMRTKDSDSRPVAQNAPVDLKQSLPRAPLSTDLRFVRGADADVTRPDKVHAEKSADQLAEKADESVPASAMRSRAERAAPAKPSRAPSHAGGTIVMSESVGSVAQPNAALPTQSANSIKEGQQIAPSRQTGGVLVVQCDISHQAAQQRSFDQVLAQNQIVRQTANADKEVPKGDIPDVEMVYIEASPRQVEATLDQLAAEPKQFLTVSVEPAPGEPSQQPWAQYTRRGEPSQPRGVARDFGRAKQTAEELAGPRTDMPRDVAKLKSSLGAAENSGEAVQRTEVSDARVQRMAIANNQLVAQSDATAQLARSGNTAQTTSACRVLFVLRVVGLTAESDYPGSRGASGTKAAETPPAER
jgi:anti-sigma factor RsiW